MSGSVRIFSLLTGLAVFALFSFKAIMSSSPPNLEITLSSPSIPPSFSDPLTLTFDVSVTNQGGSPATVLKWGSPLDERANVLGVFEIRDVESDEIVPLNSIKFNRQLPPPKEDFVEIASGGSVTAAVTIPLVPLVGGRSYTLKAKGWWQAVWERSLDDVPESDLDQLKGALRGEFVSEAVPVVEG
ncbi:uncharacterized protein DSM5745_00067 [Aspergillus mulundensis]|uniref:Water stress and hypersensitive response domain-containing protein n=1 Tax=Aspergillus mulundensis TaxID=1810919 RepID=A0A3D8T2F5_9EURO|nr:Uncharacterized protein DSM5745_00067 [Aspergillus mulundensis]RDW92745.1 Uncharacterized protein DSM5745_00067 [Aspergillus mulundensis]